MDQRNKAPHSSAMRRTMASISRSVVGSSNSRSPRTIARSRSYPSRSASQDAWAARSNGSPEQLTSRTERRAAESRRFMEGCLSRRVVVQTTHGVNSHLFTPKRGFCIRQATRQRVTCVAVRGEGYRRIQRLVPLSGVYLAPDTTPRVVGTER